jgi:hypothetical protein
VWTGRIVSKLAGSSAPWYSDSMKAWLGVIGRACIEFAIILVLASFAAGAAKTVVLPTGDIRTIAESAIQSALGLAPLAAVLTLFLAFFSFESRIPSRFAGWIGLLVLGAILVSAGIGARRIPLLRSSVLGGRALSAAIAAAKNPRLIPAGSAVQRGRVALWIGSYAGNEGLDAVAVDFGADTPRLAYAPRADIDPSTGDTEIQGRSYGAALPPPHPLSLVPEASIFSGAWIWDRLAGMDADPLLLALATGGGFLLLAVGFRFLCAISPWPLANALFAVAGLAGLLALDAVLAGAPARQGMDLLSGKLGLPLRGPLLLACLEGLVGILLAIADLAAASRGKAKAAR